MPDFSHIYFIFYYNIHFHFHSCVLFYVRLSHTIKMRYIQVCGFNMAKCETVQSARILQQGSLHEGSLGDHSPCPHLSIQHQMSISDMLHMIIHAPSIPQDVSDERMQYGGGGNPRMPDLTPALIIQRQTGCQSREYIVWLYLRNSSSRPN